MKNMVGGEGDTVDDGQFRLRRVRLRQYRSIADCDVRLGQLTLLVGANGSGKGNFLDALRLVADALRTTLDHALRDRGGVTEVLRRSVDYPTDFGIRLWFSHGNVQGEYGFQVAAISAENSRGFRIAREDCRIRVLNDGYDPASPLGHAGFSLRDGCLVDQTEAVMPPPPATVDRLYLVNAADLPVFHELFRALSGINVYNLNPDAMKTSQPPDSGELMRRDGSNIGSVLERLHRDNSESKERIAEYLRRIAEGIMWPLAFQAPSMSDGTMRALGVLTALFGGVGKSFSPVGIEEPESTLHPAAAGLLVDAFRDASSRRQVFASSHSPDLLDSLSIEPNELLAVTASDGLTAIGPIDDTGRYALQKGLTRPASCFGWISSGRPRNPVRGRTFSPHE